MECTYAVKTTHPSMERITLINRMACSPLVQNTTHEMLRKSIPSKIKQCLKLGTSTHTFARASALVFYTLLVMSKCVT